MDTLRSQIAAVTKGLSGDNVQVFNIQQVEGEGDTEVVDIYYFVSRPTLPVTYLRPARLNGNVWINKAQVSCFRVWGYYNEDELYTHLNFN